MLFVGCSTESSELIGHLDEKGKGPVITRIDLATESTVFMMHYQAEDLDEVAGLAISHDLTQVVVMAHETAQGSPWEGQRYQSLFIIDA